ncbi:PREDICTED: uncharacterized protein LOC109486795 [Branchiostoma belcheri]|uniref:Uncharacterized protein LOC109486795 n=1 Tax=Branchiostoma belcheri TaxID=7741 RepID=A0A6P5AWA4_BRABE|nr:PREDICTED: uncharacterized protein LOC109486795 [Branchiostoma belcheri]XP_019646246.1 PREDICTED: uncharacterized protein LOC109486795 [Branchiostoma belcheri]
MGEEGLPQGGGPSRLPPLRGGPSSGITLNPPQFLPPISVTSLEDSGPLLLNQASLHPVYTLRVNDAMRPGSSESERSLATPVFAVEDVEQTAEVLGSCFRLLDSSGHIGLQRRDQGVSFIHCRNGATVAKKYSELRHLMESRAHLLLLKDCGLRVSSATTFVQSIQLMVNEELKVWQEISQAKTAVEGTSSRLEILGSICDDLRTHVLHWDDIQRRMYTDKWLRDCVLRLQEELAPVREMLLQIRDEALHWVQRLITTGLHVFAHCEMGEVSKKGLWSMARGIEVYNSLVSQVQHSRHRPRYSDTSSLLHVSRSNSTCNTSYSSVKPIPLQRILLILSHEHSKKAAKIVHDFFAGNSEFQSLIRTPSLPKFDWQGYPNDQNGRQSSNTSDYHSDTASQMSSTTSMLLKVGDMKAPDLSKEDPPLIEFTKEEEYLISAFLEVVSKSTNFLRRAPRKPSVPDSKAVVATDGNTKARTLTFGEYKLPATQQNLNNGKSTDKLNETWSGEDAEVSTNGQRRRKSVHWGDNVDSSLRVHLRGKYLQMVWQSFGANLAEMVLEPAWRGNPTGMGPIVLYNPTVAMLLLHMVNQVSAKDILPTAAVAALQPVLHSLHLTAAVQDWDSAFCEALSTSAKDKCVAVSMGPGDFGTQTVRLFQEVCSPLMSVLQSVENSLQKGYPSGQNGVLPPPVNYQTQLLLSIPPTLARLVATLQAASHWLSTKTNLYLSSWTLDKFLLLSQRDLKVLTDTAVLSLKQSRQLYMLAESGGANYQLKLRLNHMVQQLNHISAGLHCLSSSASQSFSQDCTKMTTNFWQECMPTGKVWRKKSSLDLPEEPNTYAEQAVETVLFPVTEGVSKLKTTAQISAVSVAVSAMLESWLGHILKERIKFSYHGAHQLQLDFSCVRSFVSSEFSGLSADAQQSILSLDAFKHVEGVVTLLKKQPFGRKGRSETGSEGGLKLSHTLESNMSEYSHSTGPGSTAGASAATVPLANGSDSDVAVSGSEEDLYRLPNRQAWLALRVHGGERQWKLPSFPCMSGQADVL